MMNKKLLPKSFWDLYYSFPFFRLGNNEWEAEDLPSKGLSISEDKDHVFVEASLPGISVENIEINFDNGQLSIEGEKKEEEKDRKYHKKASSSFYYQTLLPNYIDEQKEPEATYKNGVMTIKFFKGGNKKKKISVKKVS